MSVLPKEIYRFNVIPIKIPIVFSEKYNNVNFYGTTDLISKAILRKKNKASRSPV